MATDTTITFDDGGAYERYMGVWSQQVGAEFLAWIAPGRGLRWLDVGCGNGAFTATILERTAPAGVAGIDPSAAQLDYARTRFAPGAAEFRQGDAMALPWADNSFDAAVMPLVIFFVPEPARGVAEMARVVKPGGLVTAYAWDLPGDGFPYAALQAEVKALGHDVPMPPHPEASSLDNLRTLWADAGLTGVETRAITVSRTFPGFDDYWQTILGGPNTGKILKTLAADAVETLRTRLRAALPADAGGRITYSARAHAVQGRVR